VSLIRLKPGVFPTALAGIGPGSTALLREEEETKVQAGITDNFVAVQEKIEVAESSFPVDEGSGDWA
jgi:hypothetical protein